MALRQHQIRQRLVHSVTPRLPEGIKFASPVLVFMGTTGERDAQNGVTIFFIQ